MPHYTAPPAGHCSRPAWWLMLLVCSPLLALIAVAVWLATRLFQRETILTRWRRGLAGPQVGRNLRGPARVSISRSRR